MASVNFQAHTASLSNINVDGSYVSLPMETETGVTLVLRASTTGVFIGKGDGFDIQNAGFELLANKEYTLKLGRRVYGQTDQDIHAALTTGTTGKLSYYVIADQ